MTRLIGINPFRPLPQGSGTALFLIFRSRSDLFNAGGRKRPPVANPKPVSMKAGCSLTGEQSQASKNWFLRSKERRNPTLKELIVRPGQLSTAIVDDGRKPVIELINDTSTEDPTKGCWSFAQAKLLKARVARLRYLVLRSGPWKHPNGCFSDALSDLT